MINSSLLVPKRAIYNLIGCLCKNTSLFTKEYLELEHDDFHEVFYKILFTAINNMFLGDGNITSLSASDIDNYLATNNAKAYEVFCANDGFDFIVSAIENSNIELFDQNYLTIKKFSILRNFNSEGFDITSIYNPNNNDALKESKLESMKPHELIDFFSLKVLNIEDRWNVTNRGYESHEGKDGIKNLLNDLQKAPVYGHPFFNKYYNSIVRGMRKGKLLIRSCATGGGKTRLALADLVACACDEIYDLDTNQWVSNGDGYPCTFISTELELKELQTCLLAIISGIPENIILNGKYSAECFQRLSKATEVIERSKMYIHYIEDFDVLDIEKIIKKDVITKNVQYVFLDYIQMTPKLSKSIQNQYKLALREDQILLQFSTRLKALAKKYKIYIGTATQVNRNSNDRNLRNATSISGGSSIINKCDCAIQVYDLEEKDLVELATIIEETQITPNCVHVIYKNRGGRSGINVYSVLDKSTVREKIAFITTKDNKLITNINPISINFLNG